MIKVENLTKIYTSKYKSVCKALDNVSFSLPDEGMVFICGKSGSGKSTMINLLAGLDEITSGDILVDGNRLSDFNIEQFDEYRNNCIGFVFQDFCLIETFTVKENIMLSLNLKGISDERLVDDILEKVGLEGYGSRYPKELSGGQKQRVAIARMLVDDSNVIIFDDSLSALDTKTDLMIRKALKEKQANKTMIIITHRSTTAKEADKIIVLDKGNIAQIGSHDELVNQEGLYKELWGIQGDLENEFIKVLKEGK